MKAVMVLSAVGMAAMASAWIPIGVHNDRNWYISDTSATIATHRANAAADGYVLATIRDMSDTEFVRAATTEQLYIGFSDEVTEGIWLWDDGWAGSYTQWNPGEPNNVGNEDYAIMNWAGPGNWNDVPSGYSVRSVVTQAVPEPASLAVLGLFGAGLLRRRSKR